ncbi:hypothetical protein [Bacillus marinisedimentorum]|nr:hypothetical protein [Bacillus marinisedimentorum]
MTIAAGAWSWMNKSAKRLLCGVRISMGTRRKVIFPAEGDHRL